MSAKDTYDVTIIGAGPAGLYSAFYCGLREMKTKIIEFQSFLGGKINVYPEKLIWDVGGLMPVTGEQLIQQLIKQGTTFNPDVVLNEKVVSIDKDEEGTFILHTSSGEVHYSKTVIIAIGGGILKPMKLQLEGAEKFEVTNLHYTVKSYARFHNKTVLISGGGNSALDWAHELSEVASKVYITYRKDTLKGHEAIITRIQNNGVQLLLNTEIERLIASEDHPVIERVILRNETEDQRLELAVDEVIVCHGYEHEKELINNSSVDIRMKTAYCIDGSPSGDTSVPGIFAAGDILTHEGKLHLIAGTFHDAANAANRAKQYITPDATSYGMVSSHNDLFKSKNKELIQQMLT